MAASAEKLCGCRLPCRFMVSNRSLIGPMPLKPSATLLREKRRVCTRIMVSLQVMRVRTWSLTKTISCTVVVLYAVSLSSNTTYGTLAHMTRRRVWPEASKPIIGSSTHWQPRMPVRASACKSTSPVSATLTAANPQSVSTGKGQFPMAISDTVRSVIVW